MDLNNKKKRAREATTSTTTRKPKEPKKGKQQKKKAEDEDKLHVSSGVPIPSAELGVFEFPWQKEDRPILVETEGCDLRDVFFLSLVDGCRAAIGFPGDRLSPTPIFIPDSSWPSDQETDGVDSIWSCALRQPLVVYSKTSLV